MPDADLVEPVPALSGGAAFLVDTILNSDPSDVQQAFQHLGVALRTEALDTSTAAGEG